MQGPKAPSTAEFPVGSELFQSPGKNGDIVNYIALLIHLFSIYMLGTVQGTRNTAKNKTKPCFQEAYILVRRRQSISKRDD